jgi:hypothetical protein
MQVSAARSAQLVPRNGICRLTIPAAAIGEESEIKACFQNVCERIRVEVEILVHELTAKKV